MKHELVGTILYSKAVEVTVEQETMLKHKLKILMDDFLVVKLDVCWDCFDTEKEGVREIKK